MEEIGSFFASNQTWVVRKWTTNFKSYGFLFHYRKLIYFIVWNYNILVLICTKLAESKRLQLYVIVKMYKRNWLWKLCAINFPNQTESWFQSEPYEMDRFQLLGKRCDAVLSNIVLHVWSSLTLLDGLVWCTMHVILHMHHYQPFDSHKSAYNCWVVGSSLPLPELNFP